MRKKLLIAAAIVVVLAGAAVLIFALRGGEDTGLEMPGGGSHYDIPIYEEFADDSDGEFDPAEAEARLREELGEEQYAAYLEAEANGQQIAIEYDLETGKVSFRVIPDSGLDHTDPYIPEGLEIADLPGLP